MLNFLFSNNINNMLREVRGKAIIIVPELFSHEYERSLLEIYGDSIGISCEILTFSRICRRICEETGGISLDFLDEAGQIIYMDKAISEVSSALNLYNTKSSIKELITFVSTLKMAKVTVEELIGAMEHAENTKEKLDNLYKIYMSYLSVSDSRDPSDYFNLCADKISQSKMFDGCNIYIEGFTGFTLQEYSMLENIIKKASEINVYFTLSGEKDGDIHKTHNTLKQIADKNKVKFTDKYDDSKHKNKNIEHLRKNMFSSITTELDNIHIEKTADIYSECEFVLSEIVKLVSSGKYDYKDITVTASDFSKYENLFEILSKRYNIPMFSSKKTDASKNPVLHVLILASEIAANGYDTDEIMKYIKTGFVATDSYALENYVSAWKINGNKWNLDFIDNPRGYELFTEEDTNLLKRINEVRKSIIDPIEKMKKACKEKSLQNFAKALYEFSLDINISEKTTEMAKRHSDSGNYAKAKEYEGGYNAFISSLEQFYNIEHNISFKDFSQLFSMVLSSYEIGVIPTVINSVNTGNIERTNASQNKVIFIMGAYDGNFPSNDFSTGIFSVNDLDELMALGIECFDSSESIITAKEYMIYRLFSCAEDKIYFSFPANNEKEACEPSFIINNLKGNKIHVTDEDYFRLYSKQSSFELGLTHNQAASKYSKYAFDKHKEDEKFREISTRKTDNKLNDMRAKLYGDTLKLSASKIEKINSCNFAYFMQYGLKAKPLKKFDFDAMKMGTFIHFILEKLMQNENLTKENLKEEIDKLVEVFIEANLGTVKKTARFNYIFTKLCNSVYEIAIDVLLEMEVSQFKPLNFEAGFGHGEMIHPIEIKEDGKLIAEISGKVDRIDGYEDENQTLYLRVVDYKSGKKEFKLSDIYYGMNLQMLIYLFALEKLNYKNNKTKKSAGILYIRTAEKFANLDSGDSKEQILVKQKKRSGLLCDEKDILKAMENSVKPVYLPVSYLKNGDFSASSSVTSIERLGKLSKFIDSKLMLITKEVLKGDVTETPYKYGDNTACEFCDYKISCSFEEDCHDFRIFEPIKNPEFWEEVEKNVD